MKKKGIKLIISFGALAAVAAVIAAYFLIPDEIRKITGIEDGQEIYIGEMAEPDYGIKPAKFSDRKSQLKFTMSDSEVASVDENGSIKANKLGETVLTISVMDFTEDITLKVVPKVNDIKGVKKTISMTEGHSVKLTPEVVPAEDRFRDEKISYSVKDRKIASVTKHGTVKGLKPGKTVITMSCGGYKEKVTVRVNEYIPEPEPTVSTPTQQQNYYTPPGRSNSGDGSSGSGSSSGGNKGSTNSNATGYGDDFDK